MGATALVVGVGRFGIHYARILCSLNSGRSAADRLLDRLVLTRTRGESSRKLAARIRKPRLPMPC